MRVKFLARAHTHTHTSAQKLQIAHKLHNTRTHTSHNTRAHTSIALFLSKQQTFQNKDGKLGKMETFEAEQLTQPDLHKYVKENDNYCARFLRKKYKCIIIFSLAIIVVFQTIYVILEKIDASMFQKIVENFLFDFSTKNLTKTNDSSAVTSHPSEDV